MRVPASAKPGIWGAGVGAVAILMVGFWGLGWTTAGSADRLSRDRAETAVNAALVPFCVAKAEQDTDPTKLAKFQAEESSYSRSQLVTDSGWATLSEKTVPDYALVRACSDKLRSLKLS